MKCPSCSAPFLRFRSIPGSPADDHGFFTLFQLTTTEHDDLIADDGVFDGDWIVRAKLENGAVVLQLWQKSSSVDEKEVLLLETHHDAGNNVIQPDLVLWMKNCPLELVTDPCLQSASFLCGAPWSVTRLSEVIARVMKNFSNEKLKVATSPYRRCCKHGVLLDGNILLTLVTDSTTDTNNMAPALFRGEPHNNNLSGMYNIVDVTHDVIHDARLEAVKPVKEEYFEVAEEEDAMSVNNFYNMERWTTRNCSISQGGLLKRRKWGHMLFLSHKWHAQGVPGTLDDLQTMKDAVQLYIADKLNTGASDTVKNVDNEDDFGVWVDYPIVPNDPSHKDCQTCQQVRRVFLAKMAALPSIATTIALHPQDERRGWILHELTMNSVGNIVDVHGNPVASEHQLVFASRINLMTEDRVMFTNGSDGWALRCHEFIRLGQMPRCWPSVTRVLLQEWADNAIWSERSTLAKDILFKYARSFHYECQGLKRAMAVLPQLLARQAIPKYEAGEWVRVYAVAPEPNVAFDVASEGYKNLPRERASENGVFDFERILVEIRKQREDMQALHLGEEVCEAAEKLQQRQFVAVTMGLRAELLYGAGWLHWVALSAITEALATAKRTVRLIEGERMVCLSTCTVSLTENPCSYEVDEVPRESWNVIGKGVPEERLRFALGKLFPKLRPGLEMGLSGRTQL